MKTLKSGRHCPKREGQEGTLASLPIHSAKCLSLSLAQHLSSPRLGMGSHGGGGDVLGKGANHLTCPRRLEEAKGFC